MKHYAKIIEDNGGGLTMYVIDEATEKCVFAHTGYQHGNAGLLVADMQELIRPEIEKQLMRPDDTAEWGGNNLELVSEWENLDLNANGIALVAEIADGKIYTYPDKMGAAAQREFAEIVV